MKWAIVFFPLSSLFLHKRITLAMCPGLGIVLRFGSFFFMDGSRLGRVTLDVKERRKKERKKERKVHYTFHYGGPPS